MAPPPWIPPSLATRFVARELIVTGSHANVGRALDRSRGCEVMLTAPHRASTAIRERLLTGADMFRSLHHSTIPDLIEVDVTGPVPFITATLVPDARRSPGPLAGRAVRAMAIDLLSLLHLLESEGIEHPSINGDHVLITPSGRVQVRGWGGAIEALPGAPARMRFDAGCVLHRALTGHDIPTATLADPHASVARSVERLAPAAFALDPILVGVIDALAQPEADQRPDPLTLLELLGLSASSLGGVGHDPDRSFRRMRFLFGLVIG